MNTSINWKKYSSQANFNIPNFQYKKKQIKFKNLSQISNPI